VATDRHDECIDVPPVVGVSSRHAPRAPTPRTHPLRTRPPADNQAPSLLRDCHQASATIFTCSRCSEMKRIPVQSTAIRSIGYDSTAETLDVEFLNGRVYRYFAVPEFLYRGFLLAGSKGDYFRTRINNRFRYEEIPRTSS
jgi:hypothetical protein